MEYKVWIDIERCDEENDDYESFDLLFASTGSFDTEEEARNFAEKLHLKGKELAENKRMTP